MQNNQQEVRTLDFLNIVLSSRDENHFYLEAHLEDISNKFDKFLDKNRIELSEVLASQGAREVIGHLIFGVGMEKTIDALYTEVDEFNKLNKGKNIFSLVEDAHTRSYNKH